MLMQLNSSFRCLQYDSWIDPDSFIFTRYASLPGNDYGSYDVTDVYPDVYYADDDAATKQSSKRLQRMLSDIA
jgi:hypothetical protein